MLNRRDLIRLAGAMTAAAGFILSTSAAPRAQGTVPSIDKRITYILPQWLGFLSAPPAEVSRQVSSLRSRIADGPRVRVGFTTYIGVSMTPVDPSDTQAVRTALAGTVAQMDDAIAR